MDVLPPRVCVFDVNGTLLDLRSLDVHFERVFGNPAVGKAWFDQVIQSALVSTITGAYADFGTIARAALQMTAERSGVSLAEADEKALLGGLRTLPPYPEVPGALERLQGAGLRLAALTNSTSETAETVLRQANLRDFFELVLSADSVRRLKPAPEPYRMAAEQLGVPVDRVRLIAAHNWDIAGALRAGCAAAFVARPGMVLDPLVDAPDIVGADLQEVAGHVLERETPASDLHPW